MKSEGRPTLKSHLTIITAYIPRQNYLWIYLPLPPSPSLATPPRKRGKEGEGEGEGGLRQLCTCATNTYYIRISFRNRPSSPLDAPLPQPPHQLVVLRSRVMSLRTFTCTSCTSTSIYVRRLIASLTMLRLCQSFPPSTSIFPTIFLFDVFYCEIEVNRYRFECSGDLHLGVKGFLNNGG